MNSFGIVLIIFITSMICYEYGYSKAQSEYFDYEIKRRAEEIRKELE